jgi:hypothetical protein
MVGGLSPGIPGWLTPRRKALMAAAICTAALAVAAVLILLHWR